MRRAAQRAGGQSLAKQKLLTVRRYDSVHGRYAHEVTSSGDTLVVGGKPVKVFAKK